MTRATHCVESIQGETAEGRWEMATRPPSNYLRPYVRSLSGYLERATRPQRRPEFPVPHVVVVFEFSRPVCLWALGDHQRASRFPGGFVAGLDERSTLTEHDGFQHGLQVNLTPIGARLVFGVPMSELARRIVSVRDVLPKDLTERLQELPGWAARFDLVERVLSERIGAASPDTAVAAWAFHRIEEARGAVDVRVVARELGYSHKHLIHLFRQHVGIPPKLLARIMRFDRLIQHLRRGATGTWADLSLEFGYYDQAHMARDVKEFTGVTPTRARAALADFAGVLV